MVCWVEARRSRITSPRRPTATHPRRVPSSVAISATPATMPLSMRESVIARVWLVGLPLPTAVIRWPSRS